MEVIVISLILGVIIIVALAFFSQKSKADVSQNINSAFHEMRQEILLVTQELSKRTDDTRKDVQGSVEKLREQLNDGLRHSHSSMQQQGHHLQETIRQIIKDITEVKETNKQVLDYSSQLHQLHDILKNPKQRGVLGEYWLETLLGNVLPSKQLYKMQQEIGVGDGGEKLIADAVIFVDQLMVPIDAKFSLENFNRMMACVDPVEKDKLEKQFKADVKKRIDETSKYIRPALGTTDFAFMFVPAEGVYYNLLNAEVGTGVNSNSLIEYAFSKHVMIVSPTSFYAYLQTVLMGLRKLEIEKSTQEIIKRVEELGKHMRSYTDTHERLGKNLQTVVNQYNQTSGELTKISKDVIRITGGSKEDIIEVEEVARPALEG